MSWIFRIDLTPYAVKTYGDGGGPPTTACPPLWFMDGRVGAGEAADVTETCINAHDNTATAKVPMKRATSYWYMEAKTQNILVYGG